MRFHITDAKAGRFQASRNEVDEDIVDMEVVITITAYCRFTIERNLDCLAVVSAEVDSDRLTRCRASDIVINILRTCVIPEAKYRPAITVVGRDQDCELIVCLSVCLNLNQRIRVLGQSQVEGQLYITRYINSRSCQPVLTGSTEDIHLRMVIKYAITGIEVPSGGSSSQRPAVQNICEQATITRPIIRGRGSSKLLLERSAVSGLEVDSSGPAILALASSLYLYLVCRAGLETGDLIRALYVRNQYGIGTLDVTEVEACLTIGIPADFSRIRTRSSCEIVRRLASFSRTEGELTPNANAIFATAVRTYVHVI